MTLPAKLRVQNHETHETHENEILAFRVFRVFRGFIHDSPAFPVKCQPKEMQTSDRLFIRSRVRISKFVFLSSFGRCASKARSLDRRHVAFVPVELPESLKLHLFHVTVVKGDVDRAW